MERRTALKTIGVVLACAVGKISSAQSPDGETEQSPPWYLHPLDFYLPEEKIGNIIISRLDGSEIQISFTDIINALTEHPHV